MTKTSLQAFKAKDTRFVADWLKRKGLHKLCSVFEGIQEPFMGAFDNLEWTYDGAFEQLFGLGRGCPGGC